MKRKQLALLHYYLTTGKVNHVTPRASKRKLQRLLVKALSDPQIPEKRKEVVAVYLTTAFSGNISKFLSAIKNTIKSIISGKTPTAITARAGFILTLAFAIQRLVKNSKEINEKQLNLTKASLCNFLIAASKDSNFDRIELALQTEDEPDKSYFQELKRLLKKAWKVIKEGIAFLRKKSKRLAQLLIEFTLRTLVRAAYEQGARTICLLVDKVLGKNDTAREAAKFIVKSAKQDLLAKELKAFAQELKDAKRGYYL